MARRTRRTPVVWLPPSLDERFGIVGRANEFNPGFFEQLITSAGGGARGDQITSVIAVVKDEPQAINTETLADIEGSAYRLRRVCGKIFVEALVPDDALSGVDTYMVTCALIVLRTAAAGGPMSPVTSDYANAQVNAYGDPWIWRRTWQIGWNAGQTSAANTFGGRPPNNWEPGYANMDGPHIDVKTARIISNEERLFLVTTMTVGNEGAHPNSILVTGELRCLASMRKMAGNRRNASR